MFWATVPVKEEDITIEWVQKALESTRVGERVVDIRTSWLSEGDKGAGGVSGSKLFKVVAVFDGAPDLHMVYKVAESPQYGGIDFNIRVMLAIFEPGTHGVLAMSHNMGYNEREFYEVFSVRRSLRPGLPGPQIFATRSRGSKVSRLKLFTTGWYRSCANGILMEDLTALGYRGYRPHENVGMDVADVALQQLAEFHAGHWQKPYVLRKLLPPPEQHWCGQSLLDNRRLYAHLLVRRSSQNRLVDELIGARDAGRLVSCNIPAAVACTEMLRPENARRFLPELFEPESGAYFSALRAVEEALPGLLRRLRPLLRRRETFLMGDAHSGNVLARAAGQGAGAANSLDVRWIDFQHWGSGPVAVELAYLLLGMVDDPAEDERLLRSYHAAFTSHTAALEWEELLADVDCCILAVAIGALFHYPDQSWMRGWGTITCLAEHPDQLSPSDLARTIQDAEAAYRITHRAIRRVPRIVASGLCRGGALPSDARSRAPEARL